MATTNDIRRGLCINFRNDIYKVVEFLHVKPGKGPAFVRTKLKSLTTGKVIENTFPAGHKIDAIRVETRQYQFLYNDGEFYHFMQTDDYSQIRLTEQILDQPGLMKDGEMVMIAMNAETQMPLSVELPASVVLEVTHRVPGDRRNTATNATKHATVETGATINVTLFINEGDKTRVDTENAAYRERVNYAFHY